MQDRENTVFAPEEDTVKQSADPVRLNEQGPAESTSVEGVPAPGEDAGPPPSSEHCSAQTGQACNGPDCGHLHGQDPQMIVCPRCGNLIPYENFCPVCSLVLKNAPPAPPTPPPPAYPPHGMGYPHLTPGWQPPPLSYAAPRPKPEKHEPPKWPLVLGIVFAAVMLLLQLLTFAVLCYGVSLADRQTAAPIDPGGFQEDDYQLPGHVLPQHFIGDTVSAGGIVYTFDYSYAQPMENSRLVVVGITFENISDQALTLTPAQFRLEDSSGKACEYALQTSGIYAKDTLDRAVLMPGETVGKLLTYYATPGEYDYLPLYVLNQSGQDEFYVYLSLQS